MLKDKTFLIGLGVLVLLYLSYLIKGIMLPFVMALVFAYLLDPFVRKLRYFKISRTMGTIFVTLVFFIIVGFILMMIVPMMYNQIYKLTDFLLKYKSSLNNQIVPTLIYKIKGIPPEYTSRIEQGLSDASGYIVTFTTNLLKEIFHSGAAAVNTISLTLLTPIITFYVLRDWEKIPRTVKTFVPKRFYTSANRLFKELDITLSGYLRGQTYVCLILGGYYATTLSIMGLESGLSLGILTGMFSFIPFVGILFGTTLAVITAALQFQSLSYVLGVIVIFVSGQIMEGSFITPKLIGDKVGLHPVWIIFGLLALGALFGFVGVLVAVPLTAIVGVVIRFAITKYKQSKFYNSI